MAPKLEHKSKGGDDDLFLKLQHLIESSENRMKDHFSSVLQPLKEQLQLNTQNIATVTISAHKATEASSANATDIEQLRGDVLSVTESNNSLKDIVSSLQKNVDTLSVKNACMERRLEDQTNRSLRKTLIIRGVPEANGETTWDHTRDVALDALVAATKMKKAGLDESIERVHRGKSNATEKQGKQDIFACFYDWNRVQDLLKEFHKNGRRSGIYVDQMYGPDTAYRRSLALHRRRELIEKKEIAHGYVDFPAKLMVKYTSDDARYVHHENFSLADVPLTQRMSKRK